jgi:hypothetical protein
MLVFALPTNWSQPTHDSSITGDMVVSLLDIPLVVKRYGGWGLLLAVLGTHPGRDQATSTQGLQRTGAGGPVTPGIVTVLGSASYLPSWPSHSLPR